MSQSTSKKECIKKLREVTEELEHHPSSVEWRENGYNPTVSTICKTFGSWNEAKESAGLDTLDQGKLRFNGVSMFTDEDGYIRIRDQHEGERVQVRLHRLIAVAEYGLDKVVGKDIHHESGIPWDNRPDNLTPLDHGEHSQLH